jgi:hypothetical protein
MVLGKAAEFCVKAIFYSWFHFNKLNQRETIAKANRRKDVNLHLPHFTCCCVAFKSV